MASIYDAEACCGIKELAYIQNERAETSVPQKNPNTRNTLTMWVWTVNPEAVEAHYKKHR